MGFDIQYTHTHTHTHTQREKGGGGEGRGEMIGQLQAPSTLHQLGLREEIRAVGGAYMRGSVGRKDAAPAVVL
jgi:hypothetical protein